MPVPCAARCSHLAGTGARRPRVTNPGNLRGLDAYEHCASLSLSPPRA